MRILQWDALDERERTTSLSRPQLERRTGIRSEVESICEQVRTQGDQALLRLTEKFDRVCLSSLSVSSCEYEQARAAVSASQLAALRRALANVLRFHEAQQPRPIDLETEPGIRCQQLYRPIRRVGLYVPSGSAPLPSALIMLAVPARIAGCTHRIVCTPPRVDGTAHPAILAAAQLCGIDAVFKVGGAQAIAAFAYGTYSIPRVDKIFGPGNAYVTCAKQHVAQDPRGAACDMPAGPSEVLVIADADARPEFVASDLLAQLEHDGLAQALLVTDSAALAQAVQQELSVQAPQLSRQACLGQSLKTCRCLLVASVEVALQIANEYAPEHLILQVRSPRRWLPHIVTAGSVFLGAWTPEALGDYCSGTNHVLPTYGYARSVGGLTMRDFQRALSVQEATPEGLRELGPTAVTLAELEGLDAHASSVSRRLAALPGSLAAPRCVATPTRSPA